MSPFSECIQLVQSLQYRVHFLKVGSESRASRRATTRGEAGDGQRSQRRGSEATRSTSVGSSATTDSALPAYSAESSR